MNNKGFAITSIIYGLMLMFVVIITSFLSILIGKNRRVDELIEGVYESVLYDEIIVKYADTDKKFYIDKNDNNVYNEADGDIISEDINVFVTPKKALYHFDVDNNIGVECSSYLPKNTVLILGSIKGGGANANDIYFYYTTDINDKKGYDVSNYQKITCIN